MSHENPFWVDIPTRSSIESENGSWENIATFETRAEAVAFIREHFDETADENGRVALISGGDADEQIPDVPAINAELLDACKLVEEAFARYEADDGDSLTLADCMYDIAKDGVGLPGMIRTAIAKAEGSAVA